MSVGFRPSTQSTTRGDRAGQRVLDAELFEDEGFAQELQQLAQQIINIQHQSQTETSNTFISRDNSQMRAVGQVYGTANLGDQK